MSNNYHFLRMPRISGALFIQLEYARIEQCRDVQIEYERENQANQLEHFIRFCYSIDTTFCIIQIELIIEFSKILINRRP